MTAPVLEGVPGATGAGLFEAEVYRLTWDGTSGTRASVRMPQGDDVARRGGSITLGDELWYAVRPEYDARAAVVADGFRACSVAVDLVTDDGRRLLGVPGVTDADGLPADAAGTAARHVLVPDQWNVRRVPLDRLVGSRFRAVSVEVDAAEPHGPVGAVLVATLQVIGIRRAPSPAARLVDLVDTRRGTASSQSRSRGNTAPAVAVPHGFTLVTPVTSTDGRWTYTWQPDADRPRLLGIGLSHSPSPWIGDRGALIVTAADGIPDPHGEPFGHDRESARPYRYEVNLDSGGRVAATASDHGMVARFTLQSALRPVLRVGATVHGRVRLEQAGTSGRRWVGYVEDGVPGTPGARLYIHLAVEPPAERAESSHKAVLLHLQPGSLEVQVRIGTSHIGTDEACAALDRELAGGLAQVERRTADAWTGILSRVQVRGATHEQRRTLYANIYRMFIYPTSLTERSAVDGREVHASPHLTSARRDGPHRSRWRVVDGPMMTNNGFWDTYRTLWPAYQLLAGDLVDEILDGFVQHAREGGWTPRWAAPGYVDAMVGTSLDVVLADAAACGSLLADDAYLAALRDATCVPPCSQFGRVAQAHALLRGWVPADVPESVSWTLEGALADFGVAVLAERQLLEEADPLKRKQLAAEARYLRSRATAYRHLFDPATGFFRARSRDGAFVKPFDPAVWGGGYTETNAWGTAFSVPHDGAGLARLHGSRGELAEHLGRFFTAPESGRPDVKGTYSQVIHEMVEARDVRMGMWAPSNQPAHHIPFMATVAGVPHVGHSVVREALDRLFTGSEIGQGYPGDEDNGELSAWWFLAALGLYPLAPGSGEWVIGPPAFDEVVLDVPGRARVRVVAHRNAATDAHVERVRVDGRNWPRTVIPHAILRRGTRIDVWMAAEPNGWGTDPSSAPSSLSDRREPLLEDFAVEVRLAGDAVTALADDIGEQVVVWRTGEDLVVRMAAPSAPTLVTVMSARAGTATWRVDVSPDGRRWAHVGGPEAVEFRWPDQLRPFALDAPNSTEWVRLTLTSGELAIRQVEVLAPASATVDALA
jgi:predicted alpha-1,2-mannosidase